MFPVSKVFIIGKVCYLQEDSRDVEEERTVHVRVYTCACVHVCVCVHMCVCTHVCVFPLDEFFGN